MGKSKNSFLESILPENAPTQGCFKQLTSQRTRLEKKSMEQFYPERCMALTRKTRDQYHRWQSLFLLNKAKQIPIAI